MASGAVMAGGQNLMALIASLQTQVDSLNAQLGALQTQLDSLGGN
jgi:outer membrane murein-binding lipoprotein Lpp